MQQFYFLHTFSLLESVIGKQSKMHDLHTARTSCLGFRTTAFVAVSLSVEMFAERVFIVCIHKRKFSFTYRRPQLH